MEESSSDSQSRCPCGFWGSSKTLGLCSICYRKAHRNQSQSNSHSHSFDAGKPGPSSYHNQNQNISQVQRMDSKPFPSRSTTDNLPLSSPPGERSPLSAPTSSALDTTTPTSGASTSSHMSSGSSSGDISQQGPSPMMKQACDQIPDQSKADDHVSASTEQPYDITHGAETVVSSIAATLTSSSCITVTLTSTTAHTSTVDHKAIISQASGSQVSVKYSLLSDAKPPTQTPMCVAGTNLVSSHATSNSSAAASIKNSADRNKERGEELFDSLLSKDKTSQQTSSVKILPLSVASGSVETQVGEKSLECSPLRGVKRSREEMEGSSDISPAASPQKNKRRCFICSCKLELAQRTIGRCRCDRVFCALHRLPELHECDFNHKEDGRREAREKMVKPTRHLGPSYRREDHS